MGRTDRFPLPDRKEHYAQSPIHKKSKIKSIIGTTGCPYKCTYCYNSSTPADLNLTPEQANILGSLMGTGGRLFPIHNRYY